MCRFSALTAWVGLFSLLTIAGCPLLDWTDNNNDGQNEPTSIVGTWTGSLTGTSIQNVNVSDTPGTPLPGTRRLTIKFNSNFLPTGIPIWGYNKAYDQTTVENQVGESETFEYQANQPYREITLTAAVREAAYADNEVRVVLDLTYAAENAAQGLTEAGTGVMTFTATIDGNRLSVSGVATYTVTATANGNTTITNETINYTGSLRKKNE